MNNDIKKIVRIRLLLLFLIPGLLIFTAVYSIQSNIEKNRANKDIEGIIQFMKEQRLTGILFLDRNLEISQSICTEEISEDIWQESFQCLHYYDIYKRLYFPFAKLRKVLHKRYAFRGEKRGVY